MNIFIRKQIFSTWTALIVFELLSFCFRESRAAWSFSDQQYGKMNIKDLQVLTLYRDRMTTGRRSSPIAQLSCVGGTAAGKFTPEVVQCYNKGYDGRDVQWECKADMDSNYRFGRIEVVCEGYDYPDDPYILQGSCGLEYTLDYAGSGGSRTHDNQYRFFDNYSSTKTKSSGYGDIIILCVIAIVIYALYKTCISDNGGLGQRQYSSTDGDYPGAGGGGGWFNPDPTRRNDYYGGYGDNDAHCGRQGRGTGAGGFGGFWTGLGTGGLLGYMMGNRRNTGYNQGYYGGGFGSGPGGFGGTTGGFGGSTGSFTRTSSGFGGTRRR